ncbi:FAD-dependent oxidoreductase [Klebsiella quasivariicola]|uniref:FAD-dependent oxidoreductase n=1 Tax=Klebsiella quasivariicola TaxID=2026240 RepID=UPI002478CF4D|nr:FAD-dependent oxidoreductase [Klebsiella quasivariicola]
MSNAKEFHCDVLVVGTGAAGMSAAVTAAHQGLNVLMVEKRARFGGTAARSGGWLWIPGTHLAKAWGHNDSPEAVKTYLRHEGGESYNEARVDAFLQNGPQAVEFFLKNTAVDFEMPLTFPDYHAEAPGAMQGGRSMVAKPFDARQLGDSLKLLEPALPELTVFGMMIGSGKDIRHLMNATRSLQSAVYATKRLSKHFWETLTLGRGMLLTNGNALMGRLAKSALDKNIPIWLNSPVQELLTEDGRIVGAKVKKDNDIITVYATKGVVLAAGGFSHDVERRKANYRHTPTGKEHWSPTVETNTGDTFKLFEALGGRIDTHLANAAAWSPVSLTRRTDGSQGVMPHFIDRAKPGVIAVTAKGLRFTNEANSYHDYVQDMITACKGESETCSWLICDHHTLRRYGLGCVAPFPLPIGRYLKSGYLIKGATVEELAKNAGIDPLQLKKTVADFNKGAALGQDAAFGKGSKAYNRYQGDALHQPSPCVKEINHGPFYAVKIHPGDIGTYNGIPVDRHNRALNKEGVPIEGLFAIGNDATSIMGGNYPGAGITLGPALTFGYAVGKYIAAQADVTLNNEIKKAS